MDKPNLQALKEILPFILAATTVAGFLSANNERKEKNKIVKKQRGIDKADIEKELELLDIKEFETKRRFAEKIEKKAEEIASRGLTFSGIMIKTKLEINKDLEIELNKIKAEKKAWEKKKNVLNEK